MESLAFNFGGTVWPLGPLIPVSEVFFHLDFF